MTTYNEIVIDALTGEETVKPYTAEQIAETEMCKIETQKNIEDAAQAKAAKAALLIKLGITEEEAALLLGGTN
jgi:hypothetical protein